MWILSGFRSERFRFKQKFGFTTNQLHPVYWVIKSMELSLKFRGLVDSALPSLLFLCLYVDKCLRNIGQNFWNWESKIRLWCSRYNCMILIMLTFKYKLHPSPAEVFRFPRYALTKGNQKKKGLWTLNMCPYLDLYDSNTFIKMYHIWQNRCLKYSVSRVWLTLPIQ